MLFNSFPYILFLFITVLVFFCLPYRFRWIWLLAVSLFFYMYWRPVFILLILIQTLTSYACAHGISKSASSGQRKALLAGCVTVCIGMLVYFKYAGFFNESLRAVFGWAGVFYPAPHLDIILPLGISFFTFQTMSYAIDVYRGDIPAERNPAKLLLYIMFFPQLVAGPIERAGALLPQIHAKQRFEVERLSSGAGLILWGLFKKVVIADTLAMYVTRVYSSPDLYNGPTLLIATYFFAFQIYCDFSGYSDIAIGSARILGFDLMQNFNLPYLARSVPEFWQRWHISLSTWMRDYIYIPLGGSRTSSRRWLINVLIVFLVSGLWHGANWTFIIWGALHGGCFLLARLAGPQWARLRNMLRIPAGISGLLEMLVTFHLVLLGWVFFRAKSPGDAWLIVSRVAGDLGGSVWRGASSLRFAESLGLIGILMAVQISQYRGRLPLYRRQVALPASLRWIGYLAMIFGLIFLGRSSSDFIYFQF